MSSFQHILTGILLGTAALLCAGNPASKNVIDSEYRSVPANYWELLKNEPGKWNSNFRPYDPQSAEMLWSDSTLVRSVRLDVQEDAKSLTALASFCDESGFSILLYIKDPEIRKNLSEGKPRPANMLEMFFEAGDAEDSSMEPYYMFLCQTTEPNIWGIYPWLMEDSTFRTIKGHLNIDVHHEAEADFMHIRIPWAPLFDRLPWMKGKADNIYRLSVIRWAATGGQTWGGNVHQQSTAGYLRFPQFTEAQKTAIMKHVLICGWDHFNRVLAIPRYSFDLLPVNSNKSFERDEAKYPHTQISMAADRKFRDSVEKTMVEARQAFGRKIADFEAMPYAEREAFYRQAAPMLFNFEYDLQQAWGKYQEDQIFNEKGK